ncbi:MAG: hypothetical protein QOE50_314 [Sphingomonadales bacterium]|nr:hypothetical protein [Sphingomonadales bacterium]
MTDDGRSNAQLFLARLRDHYVEQLLIFVAEQRRNSIRGEAEVKLELEPGSRVFRSLSCADFVRNDGEPEIIDLMPERVLGFEPITTSLGGAELRIEDLRWDDVVIYHNVSFDPEQALGPWFDKWFDPDDRRYMSGTDLGNVIHSLVVEPEKLRIDFGSAAAEAFWEVLNLLEVARSTELRITSSEADNRDL